MYGFIKRLFDLLFSAFLIIICSPFLIIVVLILKFTGEGEILFNQPRMGLDQKQFKVHKFVTMRTGSEKVSTITERGDARVLPVGKLLRITKLNELPQLFNVFKGEMSFVGPRPLSINNYNSYPEHVRKRIYMGVKPGVTGIGSVLFRDEESILFNLGKPKEEGYNDIMVVKGESELWYEKSRSLWTDFIILAATAVAIIFPRYDLVFTCIKSLPFKDAYLELKREK